MHIALCSLSLVLYRLCESQPQLFLLEGVAGQSPGHHPWNQCTPSPIADCIVLRAETKAGELNCKQPTEETWLSTQRQDWCHSSAGQLGRTGGPLLLVVSTGEAGESGRHVARSRRSVFGADIGRSWPPHYCSYCVGMGCAAQRLLFLLIGLCVGNIRRGGRVSHRWASQRQRLYNQPKTLKATLSNPYSFAHKFWAHFQIYG